MALGNQYGIDLGNILAAESTIKSARLNNQAKQKEIDAQEAGERNVLAKLERGDKPLNVNALNDSEKQDIALNPTVYNEDMKMQKANELKTQMIDRNKMILKMSMPNATPEQIETLAQTETKNLNTVLDTLTKGDKRTQQQVMMNIDKNARILLSVTQAGANIQDPELKQKAIQDAYSQQRDLIISQSPNPEETAKSIPALYNANWVTNKIAESEQVYKFAHELRTGDMQKQGTKTKIQKLQDYRDMIRNANPNDPKLAEINKAIKLYTDGKPSDIDKLLASQNTNTPTKTKEVKKGTKPIEVKTEEDFNNKWGL